MKNILLSLLFLLPVITGFGQTATPGVTVLVHGFDPLGGTKLKEIGIGTWKDHAIALREYAKTKLSSGNAVVLINDEKLGVWKILEKNTKGYKVRELDINPTTYDGEVIFIYNWGDLSNDGMVAIKSGEDAAEAAADNLFSMLINTYELNDLNGNLSTNYLQNKQIHFIAHSRGNIVSLQVFNRFKKYFSNSNTGNITISQWTALDPHPASKMGDIESTLVYNNTSVVSKSLPFVFGKAEECDNSISITGIKGVCGNNNNIYLSIPDNVTKVDNYWRESQFYEPLNATHRIGEFSGVNVPNASMNNKMTNSVMHFTSSFWGGFNNLLGGAHAEVVNWYWGTFDYLLGDTFTYPGRDAQISTPKIEIKNPDWYSSNVDTLTNW